MRIDRTTFTYFNNSVLNPPSSTKHNDKKRVESRIYNLEPSDVEQIQYADDQNLLTIKKKIEQNQKQLIKNRLKLTKNLANAKTIKNLNFKTKKAVNIHSLLDVSRKNIREKNEDVKLDLNHQKEVEIRLPPKSTKTPKIHVFPPKAEYCEVFTP